MKKSKPLITGIIVSLVLFSLNCKAQINLEIFRKLGLVSQLVEIKYVSEAYLASSLNKKDASDIEKAIAIENYNIVRLDIDRIVYQLIAEMNAANSSKLFKKLNKHYKGKTFADSANAGKKIKVYCDALKETYRNYDDNILPKKNMTLPRFPLAAAALDIVGLATFFETTWKDIQDIRHQKVEGVSDVLKSLLLDPVSDDKKEGDKKDDKK